MSDDDVFQRRWSLTEDELLRMLWRCYSGDNPDAVLVELHACRVSPQRHRHFRYPARPHTHPYRRHAPAP